MRGGTKNGLSKENLKKCLRFAYETLNGNDSVDSRTIENEVNELVEYLSSENEEEISLKDFVNVMTSNTPFPKDGDTLFP